MSRYAVYVSILGVLPLCYRITLRAIYINLKWDDEIAITKMCELHAMARIGQ